YVLAMEAAWLQGWADRPIDLHAGTVCYVETYTAPHPRQPGDGPEWHVLHAVSDDGLAIRWTPGDAVWLTWAPVPLEYAVEPYPALLWLGPAVWDGSGSVDVFDLLGYLDWWFVASGEPLMLVDFVGVWL